jgi:dihydrofolate synthase / folylpolyglutamate synthase
VDVEAPLDVALPHYQRLNAAVARAAVEQLLGEVDEDAVRRAAVSVAVPGRFQVVADAPLTIVDGAHNPAGMAALAAALPEAVGERRLVACISILDDKDATGMLRSLLPLCSTVVCTTSSNPRALPPATLASLAGQVDPSVEAVIEREPRRALQLSRERAGGDGAVVATGSIYLVADLLSAPGTRRASAL